MRIITGIARGRKLASPEGSNTRPTSDRVKESLFNIIKNEISEAKVLDLFGGTGNLGLEAISRGAEFCVFIERDKNTYKILNQNIESLKFNDICEVYNQDSFTALKILSRRGMKFNLIFLDPPYGKGMIEKSIKEINDLKLCYEKCLIIGEYDVEDKVPDIIGNYKKIRTEKYGRTLISFWSEVEINE